MVGCLAKLPGVVPARSEDGLLPSEGSVQRSDGLVIDMFTPCKKKRGLGDLVSPRASPESIYANIVSGCEEWSNARTPVAVPIGLDFGQNPERNFDF